MSFEQDFSQINFPKFLQGPYLRTMICELPKLAKYQVYIMVPYLVEGEILKSILQLPYTLQIKLFTRSKKGYLPSIKQDLDGALDQLKAKNNLEIYLNNDIHAKIWTIDQKFVIIHSMNGTPHSEYKNFEAGVIINDQLVISEVYQYLKFIENNSKKFS
jgi:phosphatidylserine/phosphatidylglycerophosphate/cardiolipin synthase-like enzyme